MCDNMQNVQDIQKLTIDFEKNTVFNGKKTYSLSESKGFELISKAWLRAGWDVKHVYSFTWLGRPIIQLPEDMIRIQELIYTLKPDYIIETGVAHGGSLIYYASLCDLMDHGQVIGIDIDIRSHNREAIEKHELFDYISLIEGDSTDINVFDDVQNLIIPNSKIMVILDSNHTKEHVLKELRLYSSLISIDSYIIACDGEIKELACNGPRTEPDWIINNPKQAAIDFVKNNPNFIIDEPEFIFNEGNVKKWVSYWSNGFIKRLK